MREVILTCAVTGNLTRPEQSPYLPISPRQIAESALAAAEAGAAIVHIHVRHPDGSPSMAIEHYAEAVERIREQNRALVLNLTTGQGGRYVPDAANPRIAAPSTTLLPPLERLSHVPALRPEIATLDLNTMNSGDMVVMNTRATTRVMAEAILAAGVKPEIELFNAGDLVLAAEMAEELPFMAPLMFSIVMGVKYGWPARVETVQLAKSMLPAGSLWSAFGIGRHAFAMVGLSVLLGGHVRIGMEDTVNLVRGVLAKSNAELCTKARRIVEDLGCSIASAARAREMLALAP